MFRRDVSLSVQVTISQVDTPEDVAQLSEDVWESLADSTDRASRFAVAISPLTNGNTWAAESSQRTLTCWCTIDDKVDGLVLPKSYETQRALLLPICETSSRKHEATHRIRLVTPTPLSSLTIMASSSFAYHAYSEHAAKVQNHVFQTDDILHVGQTLESLQRKDKLCFEECPETLGPLRYTILTTEPAEGFFQEGFTKLIIIGSENAASPDQQLSEDGNDSSDEDVVIDERFLATSLTGTSYSFESHEPNGLGQQNGTTKFTAEAIWDLSADSNDTSIYVGTQDLGELGLLSGDWAIIRPENQSQSRLARVFALDSFDRPSKNCLVPGILLHNLVKSSLSAEYNKLQILPSLYGSRKPPVPLAQSITIARVASPISIKRSYETSFHRSLQQYFQTDAKLVKKGDIIAVTIDPMERLGLGEVDNSNPVSENGKQTTADEFPLSPRTPDTMVYFVVTNVEHDVAHSTNVAVTRDQYLDATVGELGCWVNPEVTRIVQEGVEHARPPTFAAAKDRNSVDTDPTFKTLYHLVAAALSRRAADFHLPLTVLLEGGRGIGKLTRVVAVAQTLGLHVMEANCYDVLGESAVQTEAILQTRFDNACACSPCILVLRHLHAFNQSSQSNGSQPVSEMLTRCMEKLRENWLATTYPVVVVATTSASDQIPVQTLALFKHRVVFESPADEERRRILETLLKRTTLQQDISLDELATETAAFLAGDLFDLVLSATNASARRLLSQRLLTSPSSSELVVASQDFTQALKSARASFSESIGAPQIPAVSWDDVGGLASVKENILDTIQLPLEHPELFSGGLKKRSGILLYGPPGTGKTLLAKAVATSFALNFFSVKGPELLNMYIGESEANVRRVFQRAKDARPCVIFFDELDSIAPKRGNHGDSGGVMDRIVSQLLAELDGVASGDAGSDIFVIGATNRPDLLDPALLRPGRFDRLLYLGVSETKAAQLDILQALTRKFKLHPDLQLELVAEACTFNFTGADFYALCADSLLKAMSRKAAEIDERIARLNETQELEGHPYPLTPQYYLAELASPTEIDVLVTQEDFDSALRSLVPSVSPAEMEHYRRVQRQFSANDDSNGKDSDEE